MMGILTLAIAGDVVLQEITKINVSIFRGKHAQDSAKVALLSIFSVLVGMNLQQTNRAIYEWQEASQVVRKLESQVADFAPDLLTDKHGDGEPIHVFVVDFPLILNGGRSLNAKGVSRVLHRALPELTNPIEVNQVYLNDQNRFGTNIKTDDLVEMKSSATILVYCKQEQAVFALGLAPVPCLKLNNN